MHKARCSIEEMPCFSRSSIKFQGHTGWFIDDLNPIWVRLLGRSQLSNSSDLPCSRPSVKFQGHTGQKPILTYIGHFRTVTPVWVHPWLWNDAQSLKQHRIGALSFFEVIHQLLKFQGHLGQKLPISTRIECFQIEFTDGNEMMQQTWYGINEVPYCFSRLSIKFQDHMGWKIDNMNPIWVMLLGQSQLSNPSDLSCYIFCC